MKLRTARAKRKFTQEQLEAKSGVPQSVISRLENEPNASTSIEIDRKLSKALRVRPGTLEYGPLQSDEAIAS